MTLVLVVVVALQRFQPAVSARSSSLIAPGGMGDFRRLESLPRVGIGDLRRFEAHPVDLPANVAGSPHPILGMGDLLRFEAQPYIGIGNLRCFEAQQVK